MTPIEKLMDEHQKILQTLRALENYIVHRPNEKDDLTRFVDVIRGYADAYHHGKEEDLLFQAMEAAGFPKHQGPLACMLSEHTEGRRLVGILAQPLGSPEPLTDASWGPVQEAAVGYTSLLRDHIAKEDQVLYPMALSHLPPEAWTDLDARFTAFEEAREASGETRRLEALRRDLVERYG